ncbi:MAG: hypothetical protein Q8P46_07500 [Hyphomicrobiales bacterium]|nr:hypothetical protein [Hyphomicrobiales bacterium]
MHRDQIDEMTTIRRRADGSIDTDYYLARGRAARSKAAHKAMDRGRRLIADWLQAVKRVRRSDAITSAR